MLIPRTKLEQDDEFVTMYIRAPYCNLNDFETDVDGESFMFYCKPYFLRINLPGRIVEDDKTTATFDADQQHFVFKFRKETKGPFADLDLINYMQSQKQDKPARCRVEVIDDEASKFDHCYATDLNESDLRTVTNHDHLYEDSVTQLSEEIQQKFHIHNPIGDHDYTKRPGKPKRNVVDSMNAKLDHSYASVGETSKFGTFLADHDYAKLNEDRTLIVSQGYGFGNRVKDYLDNVHYELNGVFDNVNVMKMTRNERRLERELCEKVKFDFDHFAHDYLDVDEIKKRIDYSPEWTETDGTLTDEELDVLKDIPKREYLLSDEDIHSACLGLIDILFAYFLERRIFMYETTVESGWGINKLSATLTWLETFETVEDVAKSCLRRALIYPLIRSFPLAVKTLNDVAVALKKGKTFVCKCLVDIHQIFNASTDTEPRYILNELYIKDYLNYVPKLPSETIESIRMELNELLLRDEIDLKELAGLKIGQLERKIWRDLEDESETEEEESDSVDSDDE